MRYFFAFLGLAALQAQAMPESPTIKRCQAHLIEESKHPHYEVALGNRVHLQLADQPAPVDAIFLGLQLRMDGDLKDFGFFVPQKEDASEGFLHFIPSRRISIVDRNTLKVVKPRSTQPVPAWFEQTDTPFCAAFAYLSCLRQLYFLGFQGNGQIVSDLKFEEDRTQTLLRVVQEYYLNGKNFPTLKKIFVDRLGYSAFELGEQNGRKFSTDIKTQLSRGWPVLLQFDHGLPSRTPYRIMDHKSGQEQSRELLLPKKISEAKQDTHMVVLLSTFKINDVEWLLVQDSHFKGPRLWKLSELENVDIAKMRAWVIWDQNDAVDPTPNALPSTDKPPLAP